MEWRVLTEDTLQELLTHDNLVKLRIAGLVEVLDLSIVSLLDGGSATEDCVLTEGARTVIGRLLLLSDNGVEGT